MLESISLNFVLFVFVLSFPFGIWRAKAKLNNSFSQVMLAIHIPVAAIISARIVYHYPFNILSLALNIAVFSIAQYLGGVVYKKIIYKP